jgi:hypothetical protein
MLPLSNRAARKMRCRAGVQCARRGATGVVGIGAGIGVRVVCCSISQNEPDYFQH